MEEAEDQVREMKELAVDVARESFHRGFEAALTMVILISNEMPAHEGTIVRGVAQALREHSGTIPISSPTK